MRARSICWFVPFTLATLMMSSAAFAQYGYEVDPNSRRQVGQQYQDGLSSPYRSPGVDPGLQQDLQRMQQVVDSQRPVGFERGTPLDPELAEQQRREEDKNSGASILRAFVIVLGLGFGLVLLYIVVHFKRSVGEPTTTDAAAVSKTLAQLRKERSSPEELAQQFFEAVRFGSFPQYRALFVTEQDADIFLSRDKISPYLYGTLDDRELKKLFRRLTDICSGAQTRIRSMRTSDPVNLTTPTGGAVRMVSNAAIAVDLPAGGVGRIPVGSMVEIEGKWKLFVPASPDSSSGAHPAVSGGPPQQPGAPTA